MANFHVDYLNGSNITGDGTASLPWATIKHALANGPVAGDTVKVAGSSTTSRDTTATIAEDRLNITTTTDLTSFISANDTIVINLNDTDFGGDWLTVQVNSITSTNIVLYTRINVGINLRSNVEIKTIDEFQVEQSTSTTVEQLDAASRGTNVIVEGGYNSAFTSIIGLTRYKRTGLSNGSVNGTAIQTNASSSIQHDEIPIFKNMAFYNFQYGIRETQFGCILRVDNIHFNNVTTNTNVVSATGNACNIYGSSFGATVSALGYYNYFKYPLAANGYSSLVNYKSYGGNRTAILNNGTYKHMIGVAGTAGGGYFGTNTVWQNTKEASISGNIKVAISPNSGSSSTLLFDNGGNITATSFDLVDGGETAYPSMFHTEENGNLGILKLPTGVNFTDFEWSVGRKSTPLTSTKFGVKDDNYTWFSDGGGQWSAVDSTVFETGDSSLKIFIGNRKAYATEDPKTHLFTFTKTADTPVGFNIRCKKENALDANTQFRLQFMTPSLSNISDLTTSTTTLSSDNWSTVIQTVASGVNFDAAWDAIAIGTEIPVLMLNPSFNQDARSIYIDSITVDYGIE